MALTLTFPACVEMATTRCGTIATELKSVVVSSVAAERGTDGTMTGGRDQLGDTRIKRN